MIKRVVDLTVAGMALIVLAPVFLLIAVLIKLDSPGPVFVREERIGRGGIRYRIWHFRTAGTCRAWRRSRRRTDGLWQTAFGGRLRRSNLDHLPQLLNVVCGEMSLVGPRPEVPEVVARYSPLYERVLALRPGMTGPALLAFRALGDRNGSDPAHYARVRPSEDLALDLRYVLRHSFWSDLRVIGLTVGAVFGFDSVAFRWLARSARRYLPWLLVDGPVIAIAFYAALFLRLLDYPPSPMGGYLDAMAKWTFPLIALYLVTTSVGGVHRRVWRFATAADVRPIVAATSAATAIVLAVDFYSGTHGPRVLPLGALLLGGFFTGCGMVVVRYRSRLLRGLALKGRSDGDATRVLIYGAGDAGQHLALRFLTNQAGQIYELVGFVDDDARKQGQRIHGLRVLGGRRELAQIVQRRMIDLIIIAINNVKGEDLRQILTVAQNTPAQIRIIPSLFEVGNLPDSAPILREVRLEDLLGRQSVEVNRDACERVLRNRIVLVTGGCGSVGSELCRQVAQFQPRHLVVLDNNETGLYDLELALRVRFPQLKISIVVADVTNARRFNLLFREIEPEVIFHAAAYKHVPLMERFPQEAVKVNVGGTAIVLESALRCGAKHFVLVSTDKAVEPHSIMGATKRIAEMLVIDANHGGVSNGNSTLCTAVRFGNVLGSRGSVVPTFARQIDHGGPVTVTHPEMTRYFMDVAEAAGLIILAASFTRGGDLFMLEMGERIRVEDLARKMIRMRGLRPDIDIPIVYTGIRPGEKLHEELVFPEEDREPTQHPLVHRLMPRIVGTLNGELRPSVRRLLAMADDSDEQALMSQVMSLARGLPNLAAKAGAGSVGAHVD